VAFIVVVSRIHLIDLVVAVHFLGGFLNILWYGRLVLAISSAGVLPAACKLERFSAPSSRNLKGAI